jgi:hypothetical protein
MAAHRLGTKGATDTDTANLHIITTNRHGNPQHAIKS